MFESIEDPYGNVDSDGAVSDEDIYASETEDEEDADVPVSRFGNLRHSLRKASPQARAGVAAKMAQANAEDVCRPDEAWFVQEVKRDDMVGLKDGVVRPCRTRAMLDTHFAVLSIAWNLHHLSFQDGCWQFLPECLDRG